MTDNNMALGSIPEQELDLEQLAQISGGGSTENTILLKLIDFRVNSTLESLKFSDGGVTEHDFQRVLYEILKKHEQLGGRKGTGITCAEAERLTREKWDSTRRILGI